MPPDLIRGRAPVRVKETLQNKNRELGSDSIGTEKALGQPRGGFDQVIIALYLCLN
jgi:hypothetical protein